MHVSQTTSRQQARYRTSCCLVRQLRPHRIRQWQALEDCALESNPFLSPLFVLPALLHLTPRADVYAVLVERDCAGHTQLIGVGLFEPRAASRILPLPHMKAYQAPGNTFQTGLLVDRQYATQAVDALFSFVTSLGPRWQHLGFDLRTKETSFSNLLEQSAQAHGRTWVGHDISRPAVIPSNPEQCDPDSYLSRNRRRKLRRTQKAMQQLGPLEFRMIRKVAPESTAADNFLHLEHQGWKRRHRCSFLTRPSTERFFREMSDNFARADRLFFTELSLAGRVVGSTSNLIAGSMAMGFKSGWADDLAHLSIGTLQEVELVRHAPEQLADLEFIDGGTGGQSWLAALWPARLRVSTGVFAGSRLAAVAAQTMLSMRSRREQPQLSPTSSSAADTDSRVP